MKNANRPAFAAAAVDGQNNYLSVGLTKREYIATAITKELSHDFENIDAMIDTAIEITDKLLEKLEI
jgi:hypothetical protein